MGWVEEKTNISCSICTWATEAIGIQPQMAAIFVSFASINVIYYTFYSCFGNPSLHCQGSQ